MPSPITVLRGPVTGVSEAGGAKRGKIRPGHDSEVIIGKSSVQPAMVVAWTRRPTDRPSRHACCIEKSRRPYGYANSLFPMAVRPQLPHSQPYQVVRGSSRINAVGNGLR